MIPVELGTRVGIEDTGHQPAELFRGDDAAEFFVFLVRLRFAVDHLDLVTFLAVDKTQQLLNFVSLR